MTFDAVDREITAVPPDDPVVHAEPEPRALVSLRREERLECAPLDFLAHADPVVGNLAEYGIAARPRTHADPAAFGKRVDRVQDEIHEHFAERRDLAGD